MEQILKDILKELKYQTKLMEDMFHNRDAKNVGARQIQDHMTSLMANVKMMPGMKQPQVQKVLDDLMNIIPGGK